MAETELNQYPDTPLKADMLRMRLSIRGLAKLLAGGDPDARKHEQERTNVKRWLNDRKGISASSSARLAPIFGRPAGYYTRTLPRERREGLEDRVAALEAIVEARAPLLERLAEAMGVAEEFRDALARDRGASSPPVNEQPSQAS